MRFNPDAETLDEAREYLLNRGKQLLVDNIKFVAFEETWKLFPGTITAHFLCRNTMVSYVSHYILKQFRGSGTYMKMIEHFNKPIITSPDCHLAPLLEAKGVPHKVAAKHQLWDEYKAIASHYGDMKANRSSLYYMNHIDEGLAIMNHYRMTSRAKKAFCLHPIYQIDNVFRNSSAMGKLTDDPWVMVAATEYRNVANAYLSPMRRKLASEIQLSPMSDVNDMLIADKIQNRKDFEAHKEKYNNRDELDYYFKAWLERLSIPEIEYRHIKSQLL